MKEIHAELRNKLQTSKTLVELLKEGREIPKEFIELASKHLVEIEELLEAL